MSHVELKSIGKSFGQHEVLRDIDLAIAEGEFVVLVGPSGCGKSTLLRMVAGLETITAGTLEIGGRVMNAVEARERDIAMVFQSYALYPHMTVGENIGFPLRIRREAEEAIGPKVASTSATIGLDALLERKPRDLSGGQRQRVAMGRAIIRDPQVFLFDEPLSNLDAKLRVQMRQQIRELHRRLGSTSIYVTHDQVEAMTLADRVVLLEGGRIQQVGSPMELYSQPMNTFVAGFIGSPEMNFLEARIEPGSDGHSCVLADGTVLTLPEGMEVPRRGPVTLAIRPEDISLGGEGIPGRVVDIELLGAETHILVETAGTRIICVLRGMHALALEERVHLVPDRERFHFFDTDTGVRV